MKNAIARFNVSSEGVSGNNNFQAVRLCLLTDRIVHVDRQSFDHYISGTLICLALRGITYDNDS